MVTLISVLLGEEERRRQEGRSVSDPNGALIMVTCFLMILASGPIRAIRYWPKGLAELRGVERAVAALKCRQRASA